MFYRSSSILINYNKLSDPIKGIFKFRLVVPKHSHSHSTHQPPTHYVQIGIGTCGYTARSKRASRAITGILHVGNIYRHGRPTSSRQYGT